MQVPTSAFFKGAAANVVASVAALGILNAAKVGLFTNTPPLTENTVLADLTQPTFAGYALQAITWSAPFQQPDGSWACQGGLYTFQATDDLTPTVVTGVFVVSGAGTVLYLAEMANPPVNLPTSAQAMLVSPQIALGNNGWGANTIVT